MRSSICKVNALLVRLFEWADEVDSQGRGEDTYACARRLRPTTIIGRENEEGMM